MTGEVVLWLKVWNCEANGTLASPFFAPNMHAFVYNMLKKPYVMLTLVFGATSTDRGLSA